MQNVYYQVAFIMLKNNSDQKKSTESLCNYSQNVCINIIMILGLKCLLKVNVIYCRIYKFSFHECQIQSMLCTYMQDKIDYEQMMKEK